MLKNLFEVSTAPNSLGNKFRQKRIQHFKNLIANLPRPINILDVGGNEMFWENASFANNDDYRITILNLTQNPTKYSNLVSVSGNALDLSQYGQNEFDVVFSNSVIEHVYTKENQIKMANEIMRVGRTFYVQTPYKHFFVEAHYILPFIQYAGKKTQYFILTKTPLSRMKKWDKTHAKNYTEEIRLLTKKEMKEFFPEAKFFNEKFLGMTKSITAYHF